MRHTLIVLAGTFIAFLRLETTAIAQVFYPCSRYGDQFYISPRSTRDRISFGRTNQGDFLELNPSSLLQVRGGMQFVYYLNGHAREGFTNCRESAWYVGNRRVNASSPAANRMLNYICDSRISLD
ncbi:hypothetical protein OsccyDRAFT_3460 [Leptolyngbyaceae cyanobacterium JSC-12]|nr:hypothetical protein OsccyDRAFT_3460 [Leptolyngbyaceae cyanobacterium JSC-12]